MKRYLSGLLTVIVLATALLAVFAGVAVSGFGIETTDNTVMISENSSYLNPPYPLTVSREENVEGNGEILNYKLFGKLPYKKIRCYKAAHQVFLGGNPLGITIDTEGLIITSKTNVVTADGAVCPSRESAFGAGDCLVSINGKGVKSVTDVAPILKASEGDVTLEIRRGDETHEFIVTPARDVLSGEKKLGLLLQDNIAGIGTLTYINPDDNYYGALGHPIKDSGGNMIATGRGKVFDADIHGVVKGERGKAGELSGSFSPLAQEIGDISISNEFGIYGTYCGDTSKMQLIELGDRHGVSPGKAYIYTTINGDKPEKYEIQIIKVNSQQSAKDKGMVLRVTDKRLLASAGGIVQGMSGSPIIQDGKLVGAVTHVFISDPTKGYGLFIDWMCR